MEVIAAPPMQSHTFHGSLADLQALVATLGVPCHWEHKGPFEMAVFDDPSSNLKLNWWPSTGVLDLVGDPEIRVVAHLVGGLEPARTIILRLLESGKDVVTANKALLAEHGGELFDRARALGR